MDEPVDSTATAAASPRSPGLDGLRALAVLAVIAFHEQLTAFPGGFLGVDVFFVLSGYLITDLLVTQWNRRAGLRLGSFWARRARRLLPALALMLVAVTAAAAVIEPGQLATLRQALLGAVTYSSNWWQAVGHQSYFARFGPPDPLQHLWSLAIEEQFYLVWPLVLAAVLRFVASTRLRAAVAWAAAALSAAVMVAVYVPGTDPSRVYYGTDTRSSALLIGSALALSWPLRRLQSLAREHAQALDAAGLAGIAVLSWAMGHFGGQDPALYPYGLLIAALAAGGVVLAAAGTGTVSRVLSWAPLRWLGVRSYGIYLWHWPVIALTAAALGRPAGTPLLWLAEAGLAVGLAAASWRWVEQPVIRDGFRATVRRRAIAMTRMTGSGRWSPLYPAVAVTAVLAVTGVAGTAGYLVVRARASSGLAAQISQGVRISQRDQAGQRATGGATAVPGPSSPPPAAGTPAPSATPSPGPGGSPGPGTPAHPASVRLRGSEVTAVGDSVMLASASALQHALPGIWIDAQVSRQAGVGVAIAAHLAASGTLRPVLVFGLGTNGTLTRGQVRQLLAIIGPRRTLILVNTYEARPWEAGDNQVMADAARNFRRVVLANWFGAIAHRTGLLWPDGVHPQPAGARLYARIVAAAVRAAARTGGPGAG
jgi:peptidoglycan/LPS O-acetylase OafA/YrhL